MTFTDLLEIKDTNLIKNLFLLSAQTFKQVGKNVSPARQLEIYGLFKQINEGNADEFELNKKKTLPSKYKAWLKNKDKSELDCQREYICLVAKSDRSFRKTCLEAVKGEIKSIKIDQLQQISQNLTAKPTSVMQPPDESEFIAYEQTLNKS